MSNQYKPPFSLKLEGTGYENVKILNPCQKILKMSIKPTLPRSPTLPHSTCHSVRLGLPKLNYWELKGGWAHFGFRWWNSDKYIHFYDTFCISILQFWTKWCAKNKNPFSSPVNCLNMFPIIDFLQIIILNSWTDFESGKKNHLVLFLAIWNQKSVNSKIRQKNAQKLPFC